MSCDKAEARTTPDQAEALSALRAAVEAANQQIRTAAESDDAHRGMGTTVTTLLVCGDEVALLHVGDSRCYLLRQGALRQLTKDDTFVQSLVDQGVLTAQEARRHPQRSLITQAVQGVDFAAACELLTPQPGNRFLLCSDGLSDFVADETIGQALRSCPEPQQCAERLVQLALQAGAPDNVTVVVADVATEPPPVVADVATEPPPVVADVATEPPPVVADR